MCHKLYLLPYRSREVGQGRPVSPEGDRKGSQLLDVIPVHPPFCLHSADHLECTVLTSKGVDNLE